MSKFDFTLTEQDIEYITKLMMYCKEHGLEYFSSDTFRKAKLDMECQYATCRYPLYNPNNKRCVQKGKRCVFLKMQDPQHEIGTLFAKMKANGVSEPVGEVPSDIPTNNFRKVDLCRFNWKRWRIIVHSRLEMFT